MDISGEFLRPEFAFEREFGQFRNWWARDKRIVGNAFSLLIYLVSHDRNYRVTQKRAQRDLGLGRDAFLVARRKLERAGFLTVAEYRYPAGSIGENGRPIGGHRQVIFTLEDPEQPADAVEQQPYKPRTENPLRSCEASSVPVDNPHDVEVVTPSQFAGGSGDACAENPAGDFPPLKEDQLPENQEPSSSMSKSRSGSMTPAVEPDDDELSQLYDHGTATLFRELHHRLDLHQLLDRLKRDERLQLQSIDFERAAAEVIGRSARPVGDPVAYVAAAIMREPGRWAKTELLTEPNRATSSPLGRPPTKVECEASGHHWIGQWNEFCASCGVERDGWRDQRDKDQRAASKQGEQ